MKLNRIIGTLLAIGLVALAAGCSKSDAPQAPKELGKLILGYAGGACEAPVFVAYHNGFFKAEGLDVELQQVEFETLKTGISSGKIDVSVGNFGWFKAIEQGFDAKLTGGIHAGCIKLVAPKDSGITKIADLKGKTIGIDGIGAGPQITLSIVLRKLGIDPKTDVSWKAYPPPQLSEAAKKKEIDAFIVWDPFASQAVSDEGYVSLLDNAVDEPFASGFCCYSVVSNTLLKNSPEKAAAFTRAILKAAAWIGEHPAEAAKVEVDNKYVAADVALVEKLLASYKWKPGIKSAQENVKFFISEQKKDGILEADTDEAALYERIFAQVITDEELAAAIAKK